MLEMTSTENPQADASDHTAAIARWDDEGGASKSAPRKKVHPAQKGRRPIEKIPALRRMIDNKQEDAHAIHQVGRR
jgi:hypothetical protein